MDYKMMSNAELKIAIIEIEHEYEALKNNIKHSIERMKELDKKFISAKNVLDKRTKGII